MRGCLTCGENPLSLVVVNWPHVWTLSCPQMISAILSGSPSGMCKMLNSESPVLVASEGSR